MKSLFKRITVLQIIVLLAASFVVVAVVKHQGKKSEWRTVRIQIVGKDWANSSSGYTGFRPLYWLVANIKAGDTGMNFLGQKTAEVLATEIYSRGGAEYDAYLTTKLLSVLDVRTHTYLYNDKPLLAGSPIALHLNNASVVGQIIDPAVPDGGYKTTWTLVRARLKNADPWVIDNAHVGDMMTDGKNAVATISSVSSEPPQSQLVFTQTNSQINSNLSMQINPNLRDLVMDIKLKTYNYNNELYFAGHQQIKINNPLYLYLNSINLFNLQIESVQPESPQ